MYSGRRRWLARSNSEPPFPAAWALQQPPPSAADEHPKSPSGCSGSEPSPSGDDQQAERGRPLKRESQVDTVTMEQSKSHGHAVGAGLNGDAANNAAEGVSQSPICNILMFQTHQMCRFPCSDTPEGRIDKCISRKVGSSRLGSDVLDTIQVDAHARRNIWHRTPHAYKPACTTTPACCSICPQPQDDVHEDRHGRLHPFAW